MAFQVTLIAHGTMVWVRTGPMVGRHGKIVGWGDIGPGLDIIHVFDEEGRTGVERHELPLSQISETPP